MITNRFFLAVSVILLCLAVLSSEPLLALCSIEDLHVVKISPPDRTAIVRTAEGDLEMIRVGDSIEGIGKVVDIAMGRVVIQAETPRGVETIIIRIEDGKQSMARIGKAPDQRPLFSTPQSMEEMK
ncbi:MAG: hypothetical protein JRJ26_18055 [Deltaproteobacteria bacterium]|nr:hypothetical protein [Deltaproteobacteria bacterium]